MLGEQQVQLGLNFQMVQLSSFENDTSDTGAFPIDSCKFWPPRIITLYHYHWRALKVRRLVCGRARGQIYCVLTKSHHHRCGNSGVCGHVW